MKSGKYLWRISEESKLYVILVILYIFVQAILVYLIFSDIKAQNIRKFLIIVFIGIIVLYINLTYLSKKFAEYIETYFSINSVRFLLVILYIWTASIFVFFIYIKILNDKSSLQYFKEYIDISSQITLAFVVIILSIGTLYKSSKN